MEGAAIPGISALRASLETMPELADLATWEATPISGGGTSRHVYRLRHGDRDYFVKEIKANERETWKLLSSLQLTHVQRLVFPDLLERNILVVEYLLGDTIRNRNEIETGLIRDMAIIQSRLPRREFVAARPNRDDFHGGYLTECLELGQRTCLDLAARGVRGLEGYREVMNLLVGESEQIIAEYATMPSGWLHHDFREENILASQPQYVVDWGSSYGPGPFLFDLAPFLFGCPARLDVFTKSSELCDGASRQAVERWLYVATAARCAALLRHAFALRPRLDELEPYLAYQFQVYRGLLLA